MRIIEVGAVKIHLDENEEVVSLLQALLRPLNNKEIATVVGISERTVLRWKKEGRLPSRQKGQVLLVDLLRHIAPPLPAGAVG